MEVICLFVLAVQAPVALLLDPVLTPAAKVLWLAVRAHYQPAPPAKKRPRVRGKGAPIAKAKPNSQTTQAMLTPNHLAATTRLNPATVRRAHAQLEETGWFARATVGAPINLSGAPASLPAGATAPMPRGGMTPAHAGATVEIPLNLLSDPRLRPQAKLLYGLLQRETGPFTYKSLSETAALSVVTVKATVRELAEAGWLKLKQAHQLAPVQFTLLNPGQAEVDDAELRLQENQYSPEQIMKEYLSLLIECDHYEDNARPGFLLNPLTGMPLELDRYYPAKVGFEFNGRQHYETTAWQPSEDGLHVQQARDLMKEALCARNGIHLVVIHRADLTLEAMREKVGALLPLRDLRGHEALVAYLEKVSEANRT